MGFQEAIEAGFKKYFDFDTRSCRSEFWFWTLFVVLVNMLLTLAGAFVSSSIDWLGVVFSMVTLIPGISITVRRLHDLDKSGWWILIALVPFIGLILLIFWECLKGTEGPNRFGEDPLDATSEAEV